MKKIITACLVFVLLAVAAAGFAEEEYTYYFADAKLGLTVYIDDSWLELAMNNAIAFEPEYAQDGGAMLFSYLDGDNATRLFAVAAAPADAQYRPAGAGEPVWSEAHGEQIVSLYRYAEPSGAAYDAVLLALDDPAAFVRYTHMNERFQFEAENIDGTAFDCAAFYGHKVTMINVWATYCSPCINEMPDLARLPETFAGEDFALFGVVSDVYDAHSEDAEYALEITAETGANSFTHLVINENLYTALCSDMQYVPTTYFLNAEGEVIGTEVGSHSLADWTDIIKGYLAQ